MLVGENPRVGDLPVNPVKEKHLDNMRSSGKDKTSKLTPAVRFSLERAIEYIDADELVEATSKSIRFRCASSTPTPAGAPPKGPPSRTEATAGSGCGAASGRSSIEKAPRRNTEDLGASLSTVSRQDHGGKEVSPTGRARGITPRRTGIVRGTKRIAGTRKGASLVKFLAVIDISLPYCC